MTVKKEGMNLLGCALRNHLFEMVDLLLDKKVLPNNMDKNGNTDLLIAYRTDQNLFNRII